MEIVSGALLALWIAVCILTAIFFTIATISCLLCTVSPPKDGVSRMEAFSGFVFCILFAGLFYVHIGYLLAKPQETPETPATRDIHLTVPEKVEVHTEFRLDNTVIGKEVL